MRSERARGAVAGAAAGVLALAGLALGGLGASPATAQPAPRPVGDRVVTRHVVLEVENHNETPVLCAADDRSYRLRADLVGPRREVDAPDVDRMNVLVHDDATGPWFWHLPVHARYDYATALARHGETSLVLHRLGYGASRLGDGRATCLGSQADMLHQVVQHVRAGRYDAVGSRRTTPGAHHVVVHGHGVGAAVAEVEAATFDDVEGLVLMSWADRAASGDAVREAARQAGVCLRQERVAFGRSGAEFGRLLLADAPRGVRRAAVARRAPHPCGDALSLAQTLVATSLTTHRIEAPVLLLFGGRDALLRDGAAASQQRSYASDVDVTTTVVRGAGSALPLERSAPRTRDRVLHWLRGHTPAG